MVGIHGLLSGPTPSALDVEESIEDIREMMLDAMGPDSATRHPQVTRRIRYAQDLQALWYLRGELMAILAALHGEAQAREIVLAISQEFEGLLPGGLSSRPSPLA